MIGILVPTRFEAALLLKRLTHLTKLSRRKDLVYSGELNGKVLVVAIISMGERANTVTRNLLEQYQFERILLAGFAGGLDPNLQKGATLVVSAENCAELIYCSPVPISTVAEKQRCFESSSCQIVDMESSGVVKLAQEYGVSLSILRVVSDDAHEELPMDILSYGYNTKKGKETPIKMARHLIRKPGDIRRVIKYIKSVKPIQLILTNSIVEELS